MVRKALGFLRRMLAPRTRQSPDALMGGVRTALLLRMVMRTARHLAEGHLLHR